jgi:hypothetical protein
MATYRGGKAVHAFGASRRSRTGGSNALVAYALAFRGSNRRTVMSAALSAITVDLHPVDQEQSRPRWRRPQAFGARMRGAVVGPSLAVIDQSDAGSRRGSVLVVGNSGSTEGSGNRARISQGPGLMG